MHERLVRDITVGKNRAVNLARFYGGFKVSFFDDGDSLRIKRSGERWRIAAASNIGDLRGGEGHHAEVRIVAEDDIEIVEVSASGTENEYVSHESRSSRDWHSLRVKGR